MHLLSDGAKPPAAAMKNFMADYGERLIINGYPILPIMPGTKFPGQYSSTQGWQGYPKWSKHCDRPTKAFELDIWRRWPGCGIGIPCAHIVGLDIDLLLEELALEIEAKARLHLGDTPALRIGLAPKRLLVYRADKPFRSIKRHPLELLAHGSQFVAYSIHPDTGYPYAWPHEGLDELPIARLPMITEEKARKFLDGAFKLIPPELRKSTLGPDRSGDYYYSGGELSGTMEAVSAAMEYLPNPDVTYDDWVRIGLALKGALGAGGQDLFCEWSGRSIKDEPATTLKAWRSFNPTKIGAGTIYSYAQQYGWVPDHDLILRGSVAAAQGAGHELIANLVAKVATMPPHDPETGEIFEDEPVAQLPATIAADTADTAAAPEFDADLPAIIIGERYRDLPRREMLVKGLFGVGEMSVTYGAPKTGKSFLLTSIALAIATGDPDWFGHRIKRRGLVIYCIMEGSGGFPNRLAAWSGRTGQPVPDSFAYVPVRLRFMDDPPGPLHRRRKAAAADVIRLARLVGRMEERYQLPCVLLVVDTVARAMTGRDENSTQDMGEFVDACAELQTLPSRPHVALVHHESKSGNMRGSSALLGAGDTMLRVQRTESGRQWAVEYSKDDADGEDHAFDLELVTLGTDEDGDDITSCVVVDQGKPAPKAKADKPLTNNDRSLAALSVAIGKFGMPPPDGYEIPVEYVVTIAQWRGVAIETIPGETKEKRSDGFRKSAERLEKSGSVMMTGPFAWLADPGAQSAAQMARSANG